MSEPSAEIHTLRSVWSAPIRHARSALTGGLLAVAAVVPGVSIAAEPDTSQEGISAPDQTPDVDTDSPGFDPGGDTDLPFDTGPPAEPQDVSPDDGPLESEPTDDPEGRAAPFLEPEVPGIPDEAPARPLEGTPPDVPPAPGPLTEPPTDDGVTPEGAPAPRPPEQVLSAEPGSQARRKRGFTAVIRIEPVRSADVETSVSSGASEESTSSAGAAAPATDLTQPVVARSRALDNTRVHVVQPGESLWTIAENLLGAGSSATRIAAEVARLWELNRERIPSGDPDLIAVGQELRLR
jgi:LysM domain